MKLSIVIPVYNTEAYLPACIGSVLDPSCDEVEIILVNDGSTDGSETACRDFCSRFPERIRMVTTENGGLGAARNVGLEMARGEFVLFLDSDDSLAPGAVPEMLAELGPERDIVICDFVCVDPQGKVLETLPGCKRSGAVSLKDYPELLLELPSGCNKICRRSLFLDSGIRFPGRVWYEDLRTMPKLYPLAGTIRYMPRAWYRYLQRGGSIMHAGKAERNLEIIAAVDGVLADFRERGLYARYEPQLCYMAFYHQLLTASTRVNLTDPKSPVQEALLEDFLRKFPDFQSNPYIRALGVKYRLLLRLILRREHRALHLVMRANEIIKHR